MADSKQQNADSSEDSSFINALEQLAPPPPEGFHSLNAASGERDVTDISEIPDITAFLDASSPDDDYLPAETAPLVETWVDGRRIDPRRTMFRLLGILASLVVAVFLLLALVSLLGPSVPSSQGTALEQELAAGRQIIIETGPLGEIAPFLHPERLIPGVDLDLLDEGQRVAPANYRLEFEWQVPQIIILLDLKNPATPLVRSRLKDLLQQITALITKKRENEPDTLCSLWTWDQGRPVQRLAATPVQDDLLTGFADARGTWSAGESMLHTVLSTCTNQRDSNQIVIHIADYPATISGKFSSEKLYTILKKHPRTAIAGLRLNPAAERDTRYEDPVRYMAENARDFILPDWAFLSENVLTNTPPSLAFLLERKAPVRSIRFIYKPDQSILDAALEKPGMMRRISLSLRRYPRDLKLSALSSASFAPDVYKTHLTAQVHRSQSLQPETNSRFRIIPREWIFGLTPGTRNIQYTAGRLAAASRSVLTAALPGGIFLAKSMESNATIPAAVDGIGFTAPHLVFPELLEEASSVKSNLASRYYHTNRSAVLDVRTPLLLALTGLEGLSHEDFDDPASIPFGLNVSLSNNKTLQPATSILDALSQPSGLRFRNSSFLQLTPYPDQSEGKGRIMVSGFEMLAVLDKLTRDPACSNGILFAGSAAVFPSSWKGLSAVQGQIADLLKKLAQRGIHVIIPWEGPTGEFSLPLPENLLAVHPVHTVDRIHSPIRAESFLQAPGSFALAPALLPDGKYAGPAVAAAWAAGMVARIRQSIPGIPVAGISDILLRSSEMRGDVLASRSFFNHGILSPKILPEVISNRMEISGIPLRFSRMAQDPYHDAASLFCDGFLNSLAPGTLILPLPGSLKNKRFTRAYQYFDRTAFYHGMPTTAPRYDANKTFIPTKDEREELALVFWRGSMFLFCTQNGNRGWIVNYESLPSRGDAVCIDDDDEVLFLATRHGEILAIDPTTGLLLNMTIESSGTSFRYPAIPVDHGNGQLTLALDARHNILWWTGSGSRYLTRLSWSRSGGQIFARYDSRIDAHTIPLSDTPFPPTTSMDRLLSPVVLHANGTFNILTSGVKPRYLRFDHQGSTSPGPG